MQAEPQKFVNIPDNSHPSLIKLLLSPKNFTVLELKSLKIKNLNMEELDVAHQKLEYLRDICIIPTILFLLLLFS